MIIAEDLLKAQKERAERRIREEEERKRREEEERQRLWEEERLRADERKALAEQGAGGAAGDQPGDVKCVSTAVYSLTLPRWEEERLRADERKALAEQGAGGAAGDQVCKYRACDPSALHLPVSWSLHTLTYIS